VSEEKKSNNKNKKTIRQKNMFSLFSKNSVTPTSSTKAVKEWMVDPPLLMTVKALIKRMQATRDVNAMNVMDSPKKRHMLRNVDSVTVVVNGLYTNHLFMSIVERHRKMEAASKMKEEVAVASNCLIC
jgi:alpha-glucuronidase